MSSGDPVLVGVCSEGAICCKGIRVEIWRCTFPLWLALGCEQTSFHNRE